MRPTRKVWRYTATLVEMSELREGDLFQMQKATPEDDIADDDLLIAMSDARPCDEPPTTTVITAGRFIPDPNYGEPVK
jgi:hypothetical protein